MFAWKKIIVCKRLMTDITIYLKYIYIYMLEWHTRE